MDEIKVLGNYMPSEHDASRVVDTDGVASTVKENHGTVTGIVETQIVAMRGRDPQNPSDRTPGNQNLEQRLEPNSEGICNTITTVQKDNLVMEKEIINPAKGLSDYGWHFEQNLYTEDSLCRIIKASEGSGNIPKTIEVKQATKDGYIPCEVGGGCAI